MKSAAPTPLRVLIAEDRPTDAELMVYELRRSGFEPLWKRVETEKEYLVALEAAPDVILADHALPEFDAPRALYLLKKTGLDTPLIVVTGSISEEVAVERIKQGAADYILKDRMARLGPAVRRALEEKKLLAEKRQADASLRARYQELQVLHEISHVILSSPDPQTVLTGILSKAVLVGSFDLGVIRLFDPVTGMIEAKASHGYRDPNNLQRHKKIARDRTSGRFRIREMLFREARVEENVPQCDGLRTLKSEEVKSAILVPVRTEEEVLGILQLGSRTARDFKAEEVRLLEAIGVQTGIAIQKARLYEATTRNLKRIRALHDIDKAITSTLDLRTMLNILLEKIDLLLPFVSAITVRLLNRQTGALESLACRNLNEEEWRAEEIPSLSGRAGIVVNTKAPLIVGNVQTDPRTHDRRFYLKYGLVSYAGVPLIAKGEALGVLGVYTDQEHEFTDEEVEFLMTLAGQTAIAMHNAQLYEEMVRSNKVKDEFLSVMSHELRTPLNVVMGFAAMIQDGTLGEINQRQEQACQKITRRTEDLLIMVNSILFATSLEAKQVKIDKRATNVETFFAELRSSFEAPLGKEVTLVWDCPAKLPEIITDSRKLKHVLENLVNNAIKFTDQGSVTVSANIRQEAGGKGQQLLEFAVADTGIGIARDELAKIFDKFKQVDSSESRPFEGVGLGLYIAKEFTELIGGKIAVESEPGKGSIFTVRIPYKV